MAGPYRKDIDGLRAVAVLCVLFFHAGIAPFGGGYVGVDIFFVISGYLITQLILREQGGGGFSFADFYDRRIRRILPALLLMLAAASAVAFVVLLPDELRLFAKSLFASVFFFANALYWALGTGYFGAVATDNPLLHVWSLAVEEQFYLLWPLLLAGMSVGRWRKYLPQAIALLAVASLVAALVTARREPEMAFYFLHTRAWQLLAGAFVAAAAIAPLRSARATAAIAVAGVGLIVFAVIGFADDGPFSGWPSLCAVAGTVLLLQAGQSGTNPVGAMLGSAAFVFVGRISYSLYLWHWPVLVFARLLAGQDLSLGLRCLLLALTTVLALLSWRFVEQPIRRRKFRLGRWPASFAAAAGVSILLAAVAGAAWWGQGFPGRMPENVRALARDAGAAAPNAPCLAGMRPRRLPNPGCVFGSSRTGFEADVWGDSHADALFPGLLELAADHDLTLRERAYASCAPLPGISTHGRGRARDPVCDRQNDAVLKALLQTPRLKLVILDAYWSGYAEKLANPDGTRLGPAQAAQAFERSLDGLVRVLTGAGLHVLIVGSVPVFPETPLHCISRHWYFGLSADACDRTSAALEQSQLAAPTGAIRAVAARYPNVRVFFPAPLFCDNAVCRPFLDGHLYYRDRHHLTVAGARFVGQALRRALHDWDLTRDERQPRHS